LKCVRNVRLSGYVGVDRDATSAMRFISPGMWNVANGDASPASMRKARALNRCAAIGAFVANKRDDQATVGVLSHPIAMWVCATSAMTSSTSHWQSIPAISRSEFESHHVGFDSDYNCLLDVPWESDMPYNWREWSLDSKPHSTCTSF